MKETPHLDFIHFRTQSMLLNIGVSDSHTHSRPLVVIAYCMYVWPSLDSEDRTCSQGALILAARI